MVCMVAILDSAKTFTIDITFEVHMPTKMATKMPAKMAAKMTTKMAAKQTLGKVCGMLYQKFLEKCGVMSTSRFLVISQFC